MTDAEADDIALETWPPPVVPLAAFDAGAINGLTADLTTVAVWDMEVLFGKAFERARDEGRMGAAAALRLLAALAGIVLRRSDSGPEWAARWTGPTQRSALPEDFRGAQNAALA